MSKSKMITLPAGKYVIVDPCYVVPDDDWMPLLDSAKFFDDDVAEGWTPDGKHVVGFGTAYGDGFYADNQGGGYGVDAGLIGIVRAEDFDGAEWEGCLYEFDQPFECYSEDGVLHFGHVVIDTANSDEYDEEFE